MKPKVSVVSITYNHQDYIGQALEGFVSQKTDFDFEVIIADDCSTDNTQQIIRDYAKKYPDIIKPVLRKQNVGVQKNLFDALDRATGEYLALCEGDDYWTDPEKLQRQTDFLDTNPSYALCFHAVKVFFEDKSAKDFIFPGKDDRKEFTREGLLESNYIQTNSVMYRWKRIPEPTSKMLPIDWYLHLFHAQFGKIGYIDRVMAAYRRHPGGVWWASAQDPKEVWRRYSVLHMGLYAEIMKLYESDPKAKKILGQHINDGFYNLLLLDQAEHTDLLAKTAVAYPEGAAIFAARLGEILDEREKASDAEIKRLQAANEQLTQKLADESEQLRLIKASKVWKARNKVARFVGKKSTN